MIRVLSIVFLLASVVSAAVQTVGVRGTLLCGDKPLVDAQIQIWDKTGINSKRMEVKTDKQGRFEVRAATTHTMRNFDPEIRIIHRCAQKKFLGFINKPCKRMSVFKIPSDYVSDNDVVKKWYDMGSSNFEGKVKGEDTKCF